MKSRTLSRPGTELVYSIVGSGPPVVLGHSLLCKRSMWDGVTSRLSGEFTFINVGLRGHGESSATAPFTVWDLADDWKAILDQEKIERAALCGLSTGGMTAMRLAARAAERVAGLALIDTDAGAESSLRKRVEYTLLGRLYRLTGLVPRGTIAKAMFGPRARKERPDLVSSLLADVASFDRAQAAHAMRAVFGRDSVPVDAVSVPTLVVVGEKDTATPPPRSRALAAAIPGARLEIISGAGHLTALEEPAQLAALLADFLPTCFA